MTAVTTSELADWSRYIYSISGIHLDSSKGYLVELRLRNLLRELSSPSYGDLLARVRTDASQGLRRRVLDAITTNETSFFRDAAPFEMLKNKLVPDLIDRKRRRGDSRVSIRVWSAACSTGQEAYSVGIVLKELLGNLRAYDISILGTDISNQAVAAASYATFSQFEIERGMPPALTSRYFVKAGDRWRVCDEIRSLATFRTMNLLEPFGFPIPFDIIFCRNVAIYFTSADRRRLLTALGTALARDGALIVGSTESIADEAPQFVSRQHVRSVFYQHR